MKRIILWSISLFIGISSTYAQQNAKEQINTALEDIEANNTTLKALKLETEAAVIDNKSGLTLADPEVRFNY